MKERYFFDEQREELVVLQENDGVFDVTRLNLVVTFETGIVVDDEPVLEDQKAAQKQTTHRGSKKGTIIVGKKQRAMIEEYLRTGLKTDEIAEKTGFSHEKVNKVASSMYDPSTEEDAGVGL